VSTFAEAARAEHTVQSARGLSTRSPQHPHKRINQRVYRFAVGGGADYDRCNCFGSVSVTIYPAVLLETPMMALLGLTEVSRIASPVAVVLFKYALLPIRRKPASKSRPDTFTES
jgi:hypothetical protein